MADEAADAEQVDARRIRRRFVRRQWARRWMTLRYGVAAVVALLLVCTGVWLVFFSPQLSVRHVRVSGEDLLSEARVRQAAAVPLGEQLATVDLASVSSRLRALAEVESVDVTREWPDTVRITLVERTAIAVVRFGETWRGLDAEGVAFRRYDSPPKDLPQVQASGSAGGDALLEAATVVSQMAPSLAAKVDHIEVETIDQIRLVLRSGRTVQWGSSEESARKAEVLAVLLESHPADTYDVSVPSNPTAR